MKPEGQKRVPAAGEWWAEFPKPFIGRHDKLTSDGSLVETTVLPVKAESCVTVAVFVISRRIA